MLPTDADIARFVGADVADTCAHLTDDAIASALASAPTLVECARVLTRRYGRFVARDDLARRIAASPILREAQQRARATGVGR